MDSSLKRRLSEMESASKRPRFDGNIQPRLENVNEREDNNTVRVGSRKSPLALIQTNSIIKALKGRNPDAVFELETMETLGDKILSVALPKIGEKSLFTKDLEIALEEKRVDFLVHSLKDLPTTMPEGMAIGTIYKRDDPHDCVIFHSKHEGKTLKDLPKDSVIGTSSLRRVAQLKKNFPHLTFKSVRGNLNTRLRKLEEECLYDAIVLAKAGVDRMGWTEKIGQIFTEQECLYAVGQGAMAVEIRSNDKRTTNLVGELSDIETLLTVAAERAFMRTLNGGCSTPVGCYSKFTDNKLSIHGIVLNSDGSKYLEHTVENEVYKRLEQPENNIKSYSMSPYGVLVDSLYKNELDKAERLGDELASKLIELGANEILKEVRAQLPQVTNIQIPTTSTVKL